MHLLLARLIDTLKVSLGDLGLIGTSTDLGVEDNILFFICLLLVIVVTFIIFLNFIIAEASASYEKVAGDIESYVSLQRAKLIAESEQMFPNSMKNKENLPKYIIIREVAN